MSSEVAKHVHTAGEDKRVPPALGAADSNHKTFSFVVVLQADHIMMLLCITLDSIAPPFDA